MYVDLCTASAMEDKDTLIDQKSSMDSWTKLASLCTKYYEVTKSPRDEADVL